ncbi:MAG: glucose 1-dehydrogenase [Pseudomonadota bacterium]
MGKNRLDNKTAIITGGASGIGSATARRFAQEGARVLIADLNAEKAREVATSIGETAISIEHDVREPESWQRVFDLANEFGAVTTLVNSAGISIPGSIEDVSFDQFRSLLSINLEGVFLGCKYAVQSMKHVAGCSIINVGSTLGVKSSSMFPAYSSSKGAVRMLSRSVALHCAEQGYDIRVNTLIPGAIHTEMVERIIAAGEAGGQSREQTINRIASIHPMKRLGTSTETANAIVFLASDESAFTTGSDLAVDGGHLA